MICKYSTFLIPDVIACSIKINSANCLKAWWFVGVGGEIRSYKMKNKL